MSSRKNGGKITLGMLKVKSVTTSVPSIAIRFNATAEEIEELYTNEEETKDQVADDATTSTTSNAGNGEPDSSPLRSYLRIGKRSTSVDVSSSAPQATAQPSDTWRFFSDIKGKITKSVEGKITEYKSKKESEGEGSPEKTKTTKENLSDSEDLTESSISKTCGVISTTDGVEMSTDDESPLVPDKEDNSPPTANKGVRLQLDEKTPPALASKEKVANDIFGLASDDSLLANHVESGVEAVEGTLATNMQNVRFAEDEFRRTFYYTEHGSYVLYDPSGFVDLRLLATHATWYQIFYGCKYVILFLMCVFIHWWWQWPDYLSGFVAGSVVTITICIIYFKFIGPAFMTTDEIVKKHKNVPDVFEIPAAKEFQPLQKFEGWVNEFPQLYNPHTYHISQTQSVFLKLRGNLLRVSHTKSKIPKKALWNEPIYNVALTHHRIYNILGAKVSLLPDGLARSKRWSKKYPICILLNSEQGTVSVIHPKLTEDLQFVPSGKTTYEDPVKAMETQQFSKLTQQEELQKSEPSTSMPHNENEEDTEEEDEDNDDLIVDDADDEGGDDNISFMGDWPAGNADELIGTTKLYFFGRTDRDKEVWFRRFAAATHQGAEVSTKDKLSFRRKIPVSETLIQDAMEEAKYHKYMVFCLRVHPYSNMINHLRTTRFLSAWNLKKEVGPMDDDVLESLDKEVNPNVCWVNSLAGRVLYDCMRNPAVTDKIKQRIQKKLSAIKLPYFIEELILTELNLGTHAPLIHNASDPVVDDRGLWIDLDITYSGLVILLLQTKLNLLKIKLKRRASETIDEKEHAMFHSDKDDSAESSTDDEYAKYPPALDAHGFPIQGLGGTSASSKKLVKMVDRVADSKFFQAATENKFIKKAMESVSNTDLGLKVEVLALVGTLVLNIPPPPSDRVWMSFRPLPKLQLTALPIVGERNLNYMRVTNYVEKKLLQEFQKIFVLPNMEDITIPMMSSKLPN